MKRLVLMLSLLLCGEIASSEDASSKSLKKYYVGTEAGFRIMNFHSAGKGVFNSALGMGNVFAGLKFSENCGLEAGYHISKSRKKGDNRHKADGYHVMLIGYYPILVDTNILGGIGIGHLKASYQVKNRIFNVQKMVPRVTTGFQVGLTDALSARGLVSWEDTRKLKHRELKPRQSISLTAGILASF